MEEEGEDGVDDLGTEERDEVEFKREIEEGEGEVAGDDNEDKEEEKAPKKKAPAKKTVKSKPAASAAKKTTKTTKKEEPNKAEKTKS